MERGQIRTKYFVLRLCADKVLPERFHNSENENDMNYKNSDRMKLF